MIRDYSRNSLAVREQKRRKCLFVS
jgi:hypothetical protein